MRGDRAPALTSPKRELSRSHPGQGDPQQICVYADLRHHEVLQASIRPAGIEARWYSLGRVDGRPSRPPTVAAPSYRQRAIGIRRWHLEQESGCPGAGTARDGSLRMTEARWTHADLYQ